MNMNFSLITLRVAENRGLYRLTDGHQSDLIRVPFLSFEVRNPKNLFMSGGTFQKVIFCGLLAFK